MRLSTNARPIFRGGSDRAALEAVREELENDLVGTQSSTNDTTRDLLARVLVVLRVDLDPADRFHPARAVLRMPLEARKAPQGRRARLLALADLHLAAARYAASLPLCDDLYHRQPSPLPERIVVTDEVDFMEHVRRSRLLLHRLEYWFPRPTHWLDEVRSRQARVDALVGRLPS